MQSKSEFCITLSEEFAQTVMGSPKNDEAEAFLKIFDDHGATIKNLVEMFRKFADSEIPFIRNVAEQIAADNSPSRFAVEVSKEKAEDLKQALRASPSAKHIVEIG